MYMDTGDDMDTGDIDGNMMMDSNFDQDHDMDLDNSPSVSARKKRSKASNDDVNVHSRLLDSHIKIALSLYKVQQNIYLLDFQRVEVSYYLPCSFFCIYKSYANCHYRVMPSDL